MVAVATSAMRDAENGPAFRDEIRERFGIDARTISGDEEARLTFLGATAGRGAGAETLVIDIGGGSTEYVTGQAGSDPASTSPPAWARCATPSATSTRDPPDRRRAGRAGRGRARDRRRARCPRRCAERVEEGIAVAGTATSLAAIDQELDPYDPEKVHGYRFGRGDLRADRRPARGADGRRAPRASKGCTPTAPPRSSPARSSCSSRCATFDLDEVEVSEADILHGAALAAAARTRAKD